MIITLSILAAVAVGPSLCNPIISPNTTIPINHSISADRPPVQHPKGWKPPMDPLDPSTYNGDVLNVTRCHCADPDDGIRKGYYYQYDYYNWHENAYYTAHRSCDSRKHSHLIDHGWQPHCWSRGGWATFHKACGHRTRPEHSPVHPGKFCFQIEALRQVNLNYT